jgi:hypothetical protein
MNSVFIVLFVSIAASVVQASLDKAGVGRLEDSRPTTWSAALMLISLPMAFLSNIGAIVIVAWSFFVLPWLPTLITVAAAFVGFSLLWGASLAALRRSFLWYSICSSGIPLVLGLRFISSACVVYLAVRYLKSGF